MKPIIPGSRRIANIHRSAFLPVPSCAGTLLGDTVLQLDEDTALGSGHARHTFRNIAGHAKGVDNMASLMSWTNEQFDPKLDWSKIACIRDQWGGKLILKGILDEYEARISL